MTKKILTLQNLMLSKKIDGLLVPSHDEFYSEIVPPQNARLQYITNFSGSNGAAVITTSDNHFLFTDGRYLLQAQKELPKNFKIIDIAQTSLFSWLSDFLTQHILGLQSNLYSIDFIEKLSTHANKDKLKILNNNLIDEIWEQRPQLPIHKIRLHPLKYSGASTKTKLSDFRKEMKKQRVETFVLNTPESICWLLNIRGQDSEYSPLAFSYLVISQTSTTLFLDSAIDNSIKKYFAKNHIDYLKLSQLREFLNTIKHQKNTYTTKRAPFSVKEVIPTIKTTQDFSELPRACKNKIEISNAIKAHNKDSLALTSCLEWIKKHSITPHLTEITISEKLLDFRLKQHNFICPSFASIVGFREHGAVIHYKPTTLTNKKISGSGLLLIDSGGQYLEGTTDTTRTISIGTPTKEQIQDFTLVLKGHIQLITAIFPEGTTGGQLDILARDPLWHYGKDYAHGTGHGVGSCLSVHEGPQAISKNNHIPLKEGMILSIEPGFYKPKKYGIRIENLAYIKKSTKLKGYLEFEVLTKVPIEENLVDFSLLTDKEKNWLKQYNKNCSNLIAE